jgi:hypothetical protein
LFIFPVRWREDLLTGGETKKDPKERAMDVNLESGIIIKEVPV